MNNKRSNGVTISDIRFLSMSISFDKDLPEYSSKLPESRYSRISLYEYEHIADSYSPRPLTVLKIARNSSLPSIA